MMAEARLEHVNLTVRDPLGTAAMLESLFDWRIRWQGDAIHGGFTVHVGAESTYLALYTRGTAPVEDIDDSHSALHGLNHLGIVVDDLDATEERVKAAGFKPHLHADYEPGRRFYFDDTDGLEIEVVSYA